MHYRLLLVFIVVAISACSKNELQTGNPLDGNWRITKVTCNDAESTFLTKDVLENKYKSYVTIGGSTASRLWIYDGCEVTTDMTPFSYGANNTLIAKDGASVCGKGCGGTEPYCTNPAQGQTITYGWRTEDSSTFILTLPQTALNGGNPCVGQPSDKVEFTYTRN